MPRLIEMVGRRFGRLVVLERVADWTGAGRSRMTRFRVRCDCNNEIEAIGGNLRRGLTESCGCFRKETNIKRFRRHGESRSHETVEYRTWCSMIRRCENQNVRRFADYGGRGIKVCERWRNSYEAFLEDMGRKPSPKHSIDRINNDGNYEPGNCRWATMSEQNRNQRPRKKRSP